MVADFNDRLLFIQVKQIASNHPEMKPSEILTNAQMLFDSPVTLHVKDESILRYVQRIRSKHKVPQGLAEMEEQGGDCHPHEQGFFLKPGEEVERAVLAARKDEDARNAAAAASVEEVIAVISPVCQELGSGSQNNF